MSRRLAAPALFLVLAAPAAAQDTAPQSVPVTVRSGAVLVKVNVGGKQALMQVDTGATTSVIDRRAAKELGLQAQGKPVKSTTVGCTSTAQPVAISGWSVGAVGLPDLTIAAVKQPGRIPRVKKRPVIGLLGNDALASFGVVSVDFADRRLILRAPFASTGRQLATKALRDQGTGALALFAARVRFGRKSGLFAVDTGAGTSFVERRAAKRFGLFQIKRKVKINAVSCNVKARLTLIKGWRSGGVKLPLDIGVSRSTGLRKVGLAGLIGAPVLASFGQATFNYGTGEVSLGFPLPEGTESAPARAFRGRRIG